MQAGAFFTAENTGAYEVGSYWGSSCGIVPDPFVRMEGWHKDYVRPNGTPTSSNQARYANDKLSALIDDLRAIPSDDPEIVPLGTEILKEIATGLPVIEMFGTSKFVPGQRDLLEQLPECRQRLRRPVVVVVELQVHRRPPAAGAGRVGPGPGSATDPRWRSHHRVSHPEGRKPCHPARGAQVAAIDAPLHHSVEWRHDRVCGPGGHESEESAWPKSKASDPERRTAAHAAAGRTDEGNGAAGEGPGSCAEGAGRPSPTTSSSTTSATMSGR